MLSLVGPCLKNNVDHETTLLIGSLAAAHSVETIGNKDTIDKINFFKNSRKYIKIRYNMVMSSELNTI